MHISQEPEDLETQTKKHIIPDVSVVDIHWYNGASGHICHVIEVNMHQMPIFYHICYKPAKRALLTSYFKQMSINHLQNSFSYILRWYLKYINIQIDYTSGLKNRGIWPQCPTKGIEFAAFDVYISISTEIFPAIRRTNGVLNKTESSIHHRGVVLS